MSLDRIFECGPHVPLEICSLPKRLSLGGHPDGIVFVRYDRGSRHLVHIFVSSHQQEGESQGSLKDRW